MKAIMYTSDVAVPLRGRHFPSDLLSIFKFARSNNASHGVTGMLSYADGHYLQVIEGEADVLDALYSDIQADNRHANLHTLVETPTHHRYFPDCSLRLITVGRRDHGLTSFVRNHFSEFVDKEYLRPFRQLICFELPESVNPLSGKTIRMTAWPDFNQIPHTPATVALCALLTRRHHDYDELIATTAQEEREQVNLLLKKFHCAGILEISDEALTTQTTVLRTSERATFYDKMRSFLGFNVAR